MSRFLILLSTPENYEEDVVNRKFPIVKELNRGTFYWCSCGKTTGEPFCDGSHGEEDRGPVQFVVREKKKIALCTCRHTKTPPVCDGSHGRM